MKGSLWNELLVAIVALLQKSCFLSREMLNQEKLKIPGELEHQAIYFTGF